jgi:hypothetical protein
MRRAGAAVAVLAAAGLGGLAFQALGQPANHPQVEMARSAVSQLEGGASPASVVPARVVDIASSTDPYLIVTDARHNVLASSASLSGVVVLPPPGVFDSVLANGEDRVTWQPAPDVRSWIVVDSYGGGFVIAGRSPGGVEQSGYLLLMWASFGAIALAGISAVALMAGRR